MRVYINNCNLLSWPRAMAEKLAREGHSVTFVDNASTYEPLLAWYETCDFRVLCLPENEGHTAPWNHFGKEMNEDFYVVTDPDLDISAVPDDWDVLLTEAVKLTRRTKCGLSLDDSAVPTTNPAWLDDMFYRFPKGGNPMSWGPVLRKGVVTLYDRPVDTTFAVYRPGSRYHVGGIRAGKPYTARHLPWHVVPELTGDARAHEILLDDEFRFYLEHANESSTTARRFAAAGIK